MFAYRSPNHSTSPGTVNFKKKNLFKKTFSDLFIWTADPIYFLGGKSFWGEPNFLPWVKSYRYFFWSRISQIFSGKVTFILTDISSKILTVNLGEILCIVTKVCPKSPRTLFTELKSIVIYFFTKIITFLTTFS